METIQTPKHPAKYSDVLIPIFYKQIYEAKRVLDPFAGTGKIAKIKDLGFSGEIYANDIEKDWLEPNLYGCDYLTYQDAEFLDYLPNTFDAIVTSPTYGNRMADHFKAKDASRRITYTHCLGKDLQDGNTGKMHFGKEYQDKHERIYKHLYKLLKSGGKLVINVSNFIRAGQEIDVVGWTAKTLINAGFKPLKSIEAKTPRMRFGANSEKRVNTEVVMVFTKAGE